MVELVVSIEFVLSWFIRNNLTEKQKKPTWRNTRRYSATSAYSSTSRPARPGCSLYSQPKTSSLSLRAARGSFTRAAIPVFFYYHGTALTAESKPVHDLSTLW